jgi:transcriptional regulator with XRE-family HTH domain
MVNNKTDLDKQTAEKEQYDFLVGQRIKELRKSKNLTQKDIAKALGVSFQQVQKYEKGIDRISFQRIYDLANYMQVNIHSFLTLFEKTHNIGLSDNKQTQLKADGHNFTQKEIDELLRNIYYSLDDPNLRKDLLKFIEYMVQNQKD